MMVLNNIKKVLLIVVLSLLSIGTTIKLVDAEAKQNHDSSKVFKSVDRGNLTYKGSIPYFKGTKYLGWVDETLENRLLVSRYKTDERGHLAYCLNWDLESPDFDGNKYVKSDEKITDKEYSAVVYGFGGEKDITDQYKINGKKLTDDQRYYITQVATYVVSDDLNSKDLTIKTIVEHDGKHHEVKNTKEMLDIIKEFVNYVEKNKLTVPKEEKIEININSEKDSVFIDKGTFYETEEMNIESSNENGKLSIDKDNLNMAYFVDPDGEKVDEEYVLSGEKFKLRVDKKDVKTDSKVELVVDGKLKYQNVHKYVSENEKSHSGEKLQRILWIGEFEKTDQSSIDFEIKEPLFEIKLTKVDENDELLDGAKFKLVDAEGYTIAEEFAEEGELIFSNLKRGKYTIIETEVPEGYTTSQERKEIEVEIKNENESVKVENPRITGSLEIKKIDVVNDEPLPNTTFQIKDEEGNVVVEGKTNENGVATFDELPYGKYTYQEIAAPEGYVIDKEPYPFEIKEDGEVVKAEMENRLIEGSIEITKIDADTEKSLEGVEFTLYDESGEAIAEKQTNGEGIVIFEDLKYGKYTMKETKELPNYNENETVYEFDVDKDGEVIEKTIENKEESVEF